MLTWLHRTSGSAPSRANPDELAWLMEEISKAANDWDGGTYDSPFTMPVLVSEFARRLNSDRGFQERFSNVAAQHIVNTGLWCELRDRLRISRPQVYREHLGTTGVIKSLEQDKPTLGTWLGQNNATIIELDNIVIDESTRQNPNPQYLIQLDEFTKPTSGRFNYPTHQKRTRDNTEIMQRAERNLDELWAKYNEHLLARLSKENYSALRALLPEVRKGELQRTPDWVEPAKTLVSRPKVDQAAAPDFSRDEKKE